MEPPAADWPHPDAANNNKEQRNRNILLQQDVQAVVSDKSKQKIQALLDQVYSLAPIEQLLLYLKLPTENSSNIDPLRQSVNPLGSRSEINQTIIWIQTHLEEDKELSLQKKGVYDEYVAFCTPNGIKPLSTADFGKVMKQVYPNVRPRRLGTRGQSKYCYSGLRSRLKLDNPQLPDLSQTVNETNGNQDCMAAAWYVVKEWAEEKLSMQFKNVISLAYYLVKEVSIAIGSEAAQVLGELVTSSFDESMHYGYINRHRETTMQLQRKLQQGKEGKRKQLPTERAAYQKFRNKKFKGSPPSTSCSTSPIAMMHAGDGGKEAAATVDTPPATEYTSCDSLSHSLPDFNSFHRPADASANAPKKTLKRPRNGKCRGAASRKAIATIQSTPTTKIKEEEEDEENAELAFDASNPYFSRERLESVSRVSKDDLDEYLVGGNNNNSAQEPEEEIIKYLGGSVVDEDVEHEQKLTQLRELLAQSTSAVKQRAQAKRRVSFERKNDDRVNFIPISSPNGSGKYSSANASPFVSPRNTPIMRGRPKGSGGRAKPHLELKLPITPEGVGDFYAQNMMPMSAPPSPKTAYASYGKFYPNTNPPPGSAGFPTMLDDFGSVGAPGFRSQSVPVNHQQMFPFGGNGPGAYVPSAGGAGTDLNELGDLIAAMPEAQPLYPSRSVPSTPLPFNHHPGGGSAGGGLDLGQFHKSAAKSYPNTPVAAETFTYDAPGGSCATTHHDFLLNGQPVKGKASLNFMPDFGGADMLGGGGKLADSNIDDLFKVE